MQTILRTVTIFLVLAFIAGSIPTGASSGQVGDERRVLREYTPPEAIVSMESTLGFDRALQGLNEISKQFTGKSIVDPQSRTNPIGVHIEAMYWRDALERILETNKLWYEEREDVFLLVQHPEVSKEPEVPFDPERPTLRTREVNISAVFFEVNHQKVRETGIKWNFFRSDRKFGEVSTGLATDRDPALGIVDRSDRALSIGVEPTWSFANLSALVQLFEQTDIGEVIASPEVTVRSGQEGRIQIGEDISIKQRDFAGNIIDRFISTGTIVTVTPEVIMDNGIPFISLSVVAERSSGTPGTISTIIAKAEAETKVLLLNGEETVIGGLYLTDDKVLREGIPLLKDLPPWFFGLRYLFGYNKIEKQKQELIILLRAQLVPTIEERLAAERERNYILQRREQYRDDNERLREGSERFNR
jgi:general secretion pathway protein D